ncbi:hypothetical protein [Escherichia coli]|uniref:hypothetical protein n=1 Tax=Escherichia coli TaxID=562 RepID=UPI000BE45FD3|nr:hypothetical protein [Escherichia coli]
MVAKSDLKYWGIDDFGRPVFKREREGNKFFYYCSVEEILSHGEDTPEKIEAILNAMLDGADLLYFKGSYPEGEPDYPVKLQP